MNGASPLKFSRSSTETGREQKEYQSLRTRLILSFTALFAFVLTLVQLVEIGGIPFTTISGSQVLERQEVFKNLNLVADLKKERLIRWIEEKCDDIHVTADTEFSSRMVSRILALHDDLLDSGLRGDELWNRLKRDENYYHYAKYLNDVRTSYGIYKRFLVVDVRNETVIFSTDDRLPGSKISRTEFLSAIHDGNAENISKVEADEFGAGFILRFAHAVRNASGQTIAVLLMDVDMGRVFPPMLHTGDGLGRTGEALLVNQDMRILSPLKHVLPDGEVAEPLEYQLRTIQAVMAASGEEGIVETLDYRGERVLAAYRHIVISPQVKWGMVIKRDRAELFGPHRRTTAFNLLVSLVGIILLVAVSIAIAGRISRPILSLSETADRVARGDLDARADVHTRDEVGFLAETFNSMVEKIQNWRNELEAAVDARTSDLNRANENLKREIAERKRSEKIQSVLFKISEAVGGTDDLDELYQVIHRQLDRLIETRNLYIALYNAQSDIYTFVYCVDEYDQLSDVPAEQLSGSLTEYVRKSGKPLLIDRKGAEQMQREGKAKMAGTPSAIWLGVPLRTTKEVIGVMAVQNYSDPAAFDERDLELLAFVSDHISMAIERKRYEGRLKLSQFTIDHSSESLFWIGSDARILRVNDFACKNLGYSREELLSMTVHDINPVFPDELWPKRWKELKEKGSVTFESIHRRKDGYEFPVEVSANYLAYEGQEYNFTFTRDISERKRIEQMKEEFISTVSHELRTPLTSIHGSIGLINTGKVGDLSPQVAKLLGIAERNSVRLKKLIDDILDIQKIESGRMKFDLKPLDLKPLLEVSIEDIKSFGDQFHVDFLLDDIEPGTIVRADSDRLKQVMNNLLSNAAKFSPPNSSVEISMKENDGVIRVEVRDNGPGIPVDFRDKIFDRFTQEDSTMTRERGGSGLGLNITRSIVEMHGGEIGFETELDIGTIFYFELPIYRESAEA